MNTVSIFNPFLAGDIFEAFDNYKPMQKPSVDIKEAEDHYMFEIELPGMSEENVEISLNDKILTVKTKKEVKDKKEEEKERWLLRERKLIEFERSFQLPKDASDEEVLAHFKNGLLTITIKKSAERKPKKIKITAA